MSPQQTIEKRQQMIQETEDFLDQELDHRQESGVFYPRIKNKTQTEVTWHHSFTSQDRYYPHLRVKPVLLRAK